MSWLAGYVCGLIFGLGLVISNMAQPTKVLSFLDLFGAWDPSLALVMAAALAVSGIGFAVLKRRAPLLAVQYQWPTRTDIDPPLLVGSALFGIGWGLVGLCPGPALVELATLSPRVFVFVSAMTAGTLLHEYWKIGRLGRTELAAVAATDG